jgi:hypothetical protein
MPRRDSRPRLSRTIKTPVGGFVALQGGLNGGMPLHLRIKLGQERVKVVGVPRLKDTPNSLHVLLRHRQRCSPAAAERLQDSRRQRTVLVERCTP